MPTVAFLLIGNIHTDGRVQKEIRSLRTRGYDVTLIQWPYSGVRGGHEHLGIEVIDYPPPLSNRPFVNFLRQMRFNFFALGKLAKLRPDFIQCNDLNTLPAGFLYRGKAKIIYDAHELFPESQDGARKRIWGWLEKVMVRSCDAYIQPEKHRLAYFAEKHAIDPSRISLVENFPSSRYDFTGRDRLRERLPIPAGKTILLYTGFLGPGRDIEAMIDAVPLLDERFVLVLLGPSFKGYDRELAARIAATNAGDRIFFHPSIPNIEMLDHINSGDIGLVFYRNTNLNNFWCASNKLYEFILCGKHVVTNDYPGLKAVVDGQARGACLPRVDAESIAAAALKISTLPKRTLGDSPFVWESQEATYLRLFA